MYLTYYLLTYQYLLTVSCKNGFNVVIVAMLTTVIMLRGGGGGVGGWGGAVTTVERTCSPSNCGLHLLFLNRTGSLLINIL